MKLSIVIKAFIFISSICICPLTFAQTHAGQMDTDGILSEGELQNPRIDYDEAQRARQRSGDTRADNPYNDLAADRDAEMKRDGRARYDYEQERREYEDRRDRYGDDYDRGRSSWWPW